MRGIAWRQKHSYPTPTIISVKIGITSSLVLRSALPALLSKMLVFAVYPALVPICLSMYWVTSNTQIRDDDNLVGSSAKPMKPHMSYKAKLLMLAI